MSKYKKGSRRYTVLESTNPIDLSDQVEALMMEDDWMPTGGVAVTPNPLYPNQLIYRQAMYLFHLDFGEATLFKATELKTEPGYIAPKL